VLLGSTLNRLFVYRNFSGENNIHWHILWRSLNETFKQDYMCRHKIWDRYLATIWLCIDNDCCYLVDYNDFKIFFFVMLMLVRTPENRAPPTPAVTISCPVKYNFLIGVFGIVLERLYHDTPYVSFYCFVFFSFIYFILCSKIKKQTWIF